MGNWSKLIGSLVGSVAGIAIALGLPETLAAPEIQAAVVLILTAIATALFPANKPA